MEVKTDNSKKVKLIASIVGFAVLVMLVLLFIHNNSAEKETANGYLVGAETPSEEYTNAGISPHTMSVFNLDGSIDFSQAKTPDFVGFARHLFNPINDVDWVLEELYAYADNVIIVHIENVDRFIELDGFPVGNFRSALALPQARVLYSFKGDLQTDDIILVYEPIRISGAQLDPRYERTSLGGHLLEQDMIVALFLNDSNIPGDTHDLPLDNLPLFAVTDWIPHNFFFNNYGNLANAYDVVTFEEVMLTLREIATDSNRGIRPQIPSQNDDIFIFIGGAFYGVWTQDGEWRREGNTFYDLFSSVNPFLIYRQGEATPIAQLNVIATSFYELAGKPNYHRGILQLYATHSRPHSRIFEFNLPIAMLSNVQQIIIPPGFHFSPPWASHELGLLMINSLHNPSPRPTIDIPVTADMIVIVREVLDSKGLINSEAHIDFAISVDLHGDGRKQTVLVANNLRNGAYSIISQAEVDAGMAGCYSIALLVDDDEIIFLAGFHRLLEICHVFAPEKIEYGFALPADGPTSRGGRPIFFDLNGDGVFEIFTSIGFWEGHHSPLVAYKNGTWATVLWTECCWMDW